MFLKVFDSNPLERDAVKKINFQHLMSFYTYNIPKNYGYNTIMSPKIQKALFFFILITTVIFLTFILYDYKIPYPNRRNYPKISIHEHFFAGGNIQIYLQLMEKYHIKKAVFVPTGYSPKNHGYQKNMSELLKLQKQYPDKISVFATVDEKDPHAPEILQKAVANGTKGLKLIGWHSSSDPHQSMLTPTMLALFRIAHKHKLPVLLHLELNGRYPNQNQQIEMLLGMFPGVKFIAAHYCGASARLDVCSDLLSKYPNFYADLSWGTGLSSGASFISRNKKKFYDFILKNQNKLMWGNDATISKTKVNSQEKLEQRFQLDLDILEKKLYVSSLTSNDSLHGLNLPKEILNKIYHQNPIRILDL